MFSFRKKNKFKFKNKNLKNLTWDGYRRYSSVNSYDINRWRTENPDKYSAFLRAGGGLSGMYDMRDKNTRAFVKKYKEYIHKSELYYK